jgi:hypothetical protein
MSYSIELVSRRGHDWIEANHLTEARRNAAISHRGRTKGISREEVVLYLFSFSVRAHQ